MVGAKKKGKIKINREKENQKEKEMEMVRTAGTRHALIARTMLAVCARFPRSPPLEEQKRRFVSVEALEGWAHGKFLPGSGMVPGSWDGARPLQWKGTRRLFRAAQRLPDVPGPPAPPSRSPTSPCAARGSDWAPGLALPLDAGCIESADWGRSRLTAGLWSSARAVFCMRYPGCNV